MKKILFISHSSSQTGAPIVLKELIRWLSTNSTLELELVVANDGELVSAFTEIVKTHVLDVKVKSSGRFERLFRRFKFWPSRSTNEKVIQELRKGRFALVYSNTIVNGNLLQQLVQESTPVITHVHELEYWIEKSGAQNLELVKKFTTHFIAASTAVKSVLVDSYGIPFSDITVVHEFIAAPSEERTSDIRNSIRRSLSIPPDHFLVVGSGMEFWRKGRDLVPQLLNYLQAEQLRSPVHLLWVGNAGSREEETRLSFDLKKIGAEFHFHQTGHVSNPKDYFSAADVFVLLSRDDPFPLVCLEAAGLGLPIVCFDGAGGMPEFVGKECGRCVPYMDLKAMSEAIAEILGNEPLRALLGATGKRKIHESFIVEKSARRILKVIEETMLDYQEPTTFQDSDSS